MLALVARLTAFALLSSAGAAMAGEAQDGKCGGVTDKAFICGPVNAEDLARIPRTDWVIASRAAGPKDTQGMFYLLNTRDHTWRAIEIDAMAAAPDSAAYPQCAEKPTTATYRGHGIALRQDSDGLTLLAIGHGGREAVEVFQIEAKNDVPALRWKGCVPAPSGAFLNSVAALPDGGFAATKFFDAGNKNWGPDLVAGKPTGAVLEWSPKAGWREIAGTQMSGPNGIAASSDGRILFVAEWGARKLHRIPRDDAAPARVIGTDFLPDNLHWDDDGQLLVTGQWLTGADFVVCAMSDAASCPHPFKVIKVEPETLMAETVVSEAKPTLFGSASTALDLGQEYWVGTWRGDRIQRVPKP
ncbi:hypothetical protein [Taklimakanibacter deserti]|uniref:hypothetical protein n=1 Tax=Taklimakanibacter deserti TaxID=2267839 RepID=UPI000E651F19